MWPPSPERPTAQAGLFTLVLLASLGTGPGQAQTSAPPQDRAPAAPTAAAAVPAPKAKAKAMARDAEPKVTSKAAAGAGSVLLRPPGSSRYDSGTTDWRDVPPWRQTSFFGIRAPGQFFIYVIDSSGSMLDDDRLIRAKNELRTSVAHLQYPQRFYVIFYNDHPIPMMGDLPRPADLTSKSQMNHWLHLIAADGGTDPKGAMALALSLRPDAVFLLSDGEFPEGSVESIARKNPRRVPIHCVDLSGGLAGDQLARIARESGGQYASRPPRTDEVSP